MAVAVDGDRHQEIFHRGVCRVRFASRVPIDLVPSATVGCLITVTTPTGHLSRLDPEEVARAVTAFINTTIMSRSRQIQPDDDLEMAGVDSMALLKVLLFIESEFGFWMPDEDLIEENIKTARAMAAYICRRGSQP
jgi:acyl carrier protein